VCFAVVGAASCVLLQLVLVLLQLVLLRVFCCSWCCFPCFAIVGAVARVLLSIIVKFRPWEL
jgi:hypothetical protein